MSTLPEFVEACKAKGASDEFLTSFLAKKGWPQDEVYAALGSYWENATGLKFPEHRGGGGSSRDAFLYLLSFATLATWACALGSMLFRFIEQCFPDPVATSYFYGLRQAVTWQMASVAVAFPIFLLVTRTILREAQERPDRLQSSVRKWLTYIALLVTAGTMIGDLIWFLDYFLTGELTSRFLLKSLTVMVICGAIFFFYLGSLRWDRHTDLRTATKRSALFAAGASAVVLVSLCVGFWMAGTPGQQRQLEADHKRVEDLRRAAMAMNSWYQRDRAAPLPKSLAELPGGGLTADPQTGTPYEYRVRKGAEYELCATFSAVDREARRGFDPHFWQHGKGRTCFVLDASRLPAWQ